MNKEILVKDSRATEIGWAEGYHALLLGVSKPGPILCPSRYVGARVSLDQINREHHLCGKFSEALEGWVDKPLMYYLPLLVLYWIWLLQGKYSCNYSSFCQLCVKAAISAYPYTEVPQ